jgi:Lon protease-like protein
MEMAKACLRDDAPFGVCLIREGPEVLDKAHAAPAVPADVGCLARIATWDMPQLGVLQIVAHGGERFRIRSRAVQADGLARAAVALLAEADGPVPEDCAASVRLLQRLIEAQPEHFERPHRLDSSAWVSARLADVLPLPLDEKQALLELDPAPARLARLGRLLQASLSGGP